MNIQKIAATLTERDRMIIEDPERFDETEESFKRLKSLGLITFIRGRTPYDPESIFVTTELGTQVLSARKPETT